MALALPEKGSPEELRVYALVAESDGEEELAERLNLAADEIERLSEHLEGAHDRLKAWDAQLFASGLEAAHRDMWTKIERERCIQAVKAEPCPFKDGPMADGWAEAWGTLLNRLTSPLSRPDRGGPDA